MKWKLFMRHSDVTGLVTDEWRYNNEHLQHSLLRSEDNTREIKGDKISTSSNSFLCLTSRVWRRSVLCWNKYVTLVFLKFKKDCWTWKRLWTTNKGPNERGILEKVCSPAVLLSLPRQMDGQPNRLGMKVSGHSTYLRRRKYWFQASSRWVTTAADAPWGLATAQSRRCHGKSPANRSWDPNDGRVRHPTKCKTPKWINKNESSLQVAL